MIRHAGLIALRLDGRWRGALIEGPSGAGKSDLALRALEAGFRLAADDRTLVWPSGGALYGRAPGPLLGLIEARGQGVLPEPPIPFAEIVLAVRCVDDPDLVERLPGPEVEVVAGIPIPRHLMDPRQASAPAKLRRAMQHLGATVQQRYQVAPGGGGDRLGTGDTH